MQVTDMQYWNIVKRNFGVPYTFFELDYEEVINYAKTYSLKGISERLPHTMYLYVDPEKDLLQRDGQTSEFIIPYEGDIHSIVNMLAPNADIIAGMPINPIISTIDDATNYLVDIMEAKPGMQLSSAIYKTFEFIEPNILKVHGAIPGMIVLKICVNHTSFETVPSRFARDCLDYCIADLKEMLGNIRMRYTEMQTPFGTINLGGDALLNQAEQIRSRVLEKFNNLPPNLLMQLN